MQIDPSFAAEAYTRARPGTEPNPSNAEASFSSVLQEFSSTLAAGEAAALSTVAGESDAHTLVHALTQSELAIETAVAVRDKIVEAYQEILRMPV